jgi:phage terminase large subunit-like protein
VIYDEFAFCDNPDFYFTLSTSQGSRRQPLACYITTAGHDLQGIGYKKWLYARTIIGDESLDPTFLAYLFELPMSEDWTLEANWYKVNPALGDFRSLDELRDSFRQAVTPDEQHKFRQLYLNQWMQAPKTWIARERWDACFDPAFDEAQLKHLPCYLAFDLSAVADITAVAAIFALPGGRYHVKGFNWLPDYNGKLRDKAIKDHVDYIGWEEQGWVTLTPGLAIDQEYVQRKIEELADSYMVKCVGYDPHGATKIVNDLEKSGLVMVKVRPGPITLSEPMKEFERAVLTNRITHDGNPCLSWQISNVVPRKDALGNSSPDKDRATGRIDCVVAGIMALHCAIRMEVAEPVKKKTPIRISIFGA